MKRARTPRQKPTKLRKTFSLSRDVLRVIEAFRAEQRKASLTEALEELVRRGELQREQARLEAATEAYYSSLSAEQMEEERAWGQFAESQMTIEEP
jgi:hypothetical protein